MSDFELSEHLEGLKHLESYDIPNEHDLHSEDPAALLEEAVDATAEISEEIIQPHIFDIYRSLLRHAEAVPGPLMIKLLDSISSGLLAQTEVVIRDERQDQQELLEHKAPLEMYAFLLLWFVLVADKVRGDDDDEAPVKPVRAKKGRGGRAAAAKATSRKKATEIWNWDDQIPSVLALIPKVLKIKTQRIWTTGPEREAFISCLVRPAFEISNAEAHMKVKQVEEGVQKIICHAVKHHSYSVGAHMHIIQGLTYHEHLSEPMADAVAILVIEFDHSQLGDELLREVSQKTFNSQDTRGPRSFSKFLVRLADKAPRSVLKQISLLLAQLDSESYPMRMAMIEVIGYLITDLANSTELTSSTESPEQVAKQLTNLYDLLLSRTLDLSSYVRARTLQVLAKLTELEVKFPTQRLKATEAAVACLEDKTSSVRKGAVTLLSKLIESHPWGLMHGGLLSMSDWQERYEEARAELQKMQDALGKSMQRNEGEGSGDEGETEEEEDDDEDMKDDPTPLFDDDDDEEGTPKKKSADDMEIDGEEGRDADATPKKKFKKSKKRKARESEAQMAAMATEQEALAALSGNEIELVTLRKKYCSEALQFIHYLEDSMEALVKLLGSTNKAEVLETMNFFRVAYEYQFDGAENGIKKMLHLIWSKDNSSTSEDGKELKGVRSRLLECYQQLYFDPLPDLDPKQQVNRIAKNMIELTYDSSLADLTSLEEMMRIMMDSDQVHGDVVNKLWQVYSSERPLPRAQRRGAINILGMLAIARRSVVTDRVDTLLKIGLGTYGKADLTLARLTCVALQRLNGSQKKVKGSLLDRNLRLDIDNPVFHRLQDIVEMPSRSKEWFPLTEQAINTIYALADHPDHICDAIIRNLTQRAFGRPRKEPVKTPSEDGDVSMDEDLAAEVSQADVSMASIPFSQMPLSQASQPQRGDGTDVGEAFELAQLLFVVGHVAIKHIVFLELVEREWKRQKEEHAKATAGKDAAAAASKDGEELDQVAGNAEDDIGDRIAGVRETELLYGAESLLAVFGPILVLICGSPHRFKNRTLRAAATLSFSKFLCVSSKFCDEHHVLLFRILETSKDANIRSNIVIALGDVAVSFSSIVDENSNELYKGLSDADLVVKKNTLMVLTHLILNGMIKVKGQLGEMAKCVEDADPRIADLAKLFFHELSTKENAIYNNLPDVISHLSVGEHAVNEDTFQTIMTYIFKYIEKEKQAENIVEKLCQRFRLTEDPRQWRDIAFCLSLLPFKSERSVKKLIEGLQFYRDKLYEPVVFERFSEILVKARSNKSATKPDGELNEFEGILEEHKKQGEEDRELERRAEMKKEAAKKRAARGKGRKKVVVRREEEDEDE